MPTISTGTTAPTSVLVEGDYVAANQQQVFVYEQLISGTPSPSNSILVGNVQTTPNAGTFGGNGGIDENGNDFALAVVLSGSTTYLLGATGASGNIFLSAVTAISSRSAPLIIKSTSTPSQGPSSSVPSGRQVRPASPARPAPSEPQVQSASRV